MKKIFLVIMLLLCSTIVLAEDISLKLNGEDVDGEMDLVAATDVDFELSIAPQIRIKDISVEADNELVRQLIEEALNDFEAPERFPETFQKKSSFSLPQILPAGSYTLTVNVKYSDANYQDKTLTKTVTFNLIAEGAASMMAGMLLKMMPDDGASEVVDAITGRTLDPVPREPTFDEVMGVAQELGLSAEDILAGNYEMKEIDSMQETTELTTESIDAMMEGMTDPKARAAMEALKKMKKPKVEKQMKVFELSNGERKAYQSKIVISIGYEDSLNHLQLIETIPKSVAQDVSELMFSEDPEVLIADPVVKWNFNHIPKGQKKEYSYTINKKLEQIESNSVAAGIEPGFFAKLIAKLIARFTQ